MNKFLLSTALVVVGAMSVSAQTLEEDHKIVWTPAPTTAINLIDNPGGVSSVELSGSGPLTINRNCKLYATIERDGEIMKQIPASNRQAVYTFEGFDKTEKGDLHISFASDLKNSPFQYTGTYKVTIPQGYFYFPDGTLNEEISNTWGVNNAQLVVTPASGTSMAELTEIKVEFPRATKVEASTTASVMLQFDPITTGTVIEGDEGDEGIALDEIALDVVFDGLTATVKIGDNETYKKYIEEYKKGTAKVIFSTGCFHAWYPGRSGYSSNYQSSVTYNVLGAGEDSNGGYTIVPAPGEVYQFPSAPFTDMVSETESTTEAYFVVYPPEDKQIVQVIKARATLYEVVDGQRSSKALYTLSGKKYNNGNGILFYVPGESGPGVLKCAPGKYQLVIAANADWTNKSPELVYDYTVLSDEKPLAFEFLPANTAPLTQALSEIYVKYPDSNEITVKPGTYASIEYGTVEFSGTVVKTTVDGIPAILITPYKSLKGAGTYNVSVPASGIQIDGVNYPINVTYELAEGIPTIPPVSWSPAPTSSLNINDNPGGLSSVEILCSEGVTVNRACKAFATLEKNGVVVKEIPSSNKVAVYTYRGFDKGELGDLHITFWSELKTSPYKYSGTYKVTIPAGYFFYSDGTSNEEMSAEWTINNASFDLNPATGSNVTEIKTVTLTFPEAEKVEFVSGGYGPDNLPGENKETRNIFYDFSPSGAEASEDGTEVIESGELVPVINGNVATLTLVDDFTPGTVTITFRQGAFKVWYPGEENPSVNTLSSAKYNIIKSAGEGDNAGYTIVPAPGDVYQIPSAPFTDMVNETESTTEAYFVVYPPEDKPIGVVPRARATLYEVIDGQRSTTPLRQFIGKKYNTGNGIIFYIAGESGPGTIKLPEGTYQLVVAAGADYTNKSPELVYTYNFLPSDEPVNSVVTPSPETVITSYLPDVTIEFPDAKEVSLKKGTYATIVSGTVEYTADVTYEVIEGVPTVKIQFYIPFNTDGEYLVTIPGSNLVVDGVNYPVRLNYTINKDSETVGVDSATVVETLNIYSIDGRVVARNVTAEVLKDLNPGLYIINGKKVLIRK